MNLVELLAQEILIINIKNSKTEITKTKWDQSKNKTNFHLEKRFKKLITSKKKIILNPSHLLKTLKEKRTLMIMFWKERAV